MVRTFLESDSANRPYTAGLSATTAITRKHLLPMRGGTWRNVDFTSSCGGVTMRASFAHEIPSTSQAKGTTPRAVHEALLGDSFLSDGSSLQEWLYGAARVIHGMNPNATADQDRPFADQAADAEMAFFEQVVAQPG
jgi:hypothetical protein